MHSPSIAEWIVSRFTDKQRAASVVGDLLESKPQKGLLWFWLSLGRVVVSHGWRWPLGFIAALYAFSLAINKLPMLIYGVHALHRPPAPWTPICAILSVVSAFSFMVFLYSAIRYGMSDRVAQLGIALAGLSATAICFWWQPSTLAVCIGLTIGMVALSSVYGEYRKAALVLLVAVAAGFVGGLLALFLVAKYQSLLYAGPWGDQEVRQHPSLGWVTLGLLIMVGLMVTTACSRMHYWLMRDKQLDLPTPANPLPSR